MTVDSYTLCDVLVFLVHPSITFVHSRSFANVVAWVSARCLGRLGKRTAFVLLFFLVARPPPYLWKHSMTFGTYSSRNGHILRAEACIPVDLAFCGKVRGMTVDYESIRSWITYCQTHHTGVCATPSPLVPGLQLIDCAKRRIVEARASDQYCALSYVCGSREERTRQQSIRETGEKLLLASKLPQSLEDAIEVTKKLGFQYLWTDQYCIDQDGLEQEHHQISRMDSIYARADVTIIAAAGEDQEYGLPGVGSTVRVAQPEAQVEDLQLISTMGDPRNAIEDAKWSTRGWTYQEAVLSWRRVVFTDTVVYFECNQMNCCETVQLSLDMLHRHDKTAFMGFMRSGFFSGRAAQAIMRRGSYHMSQIASEHSREP
ncbi:putative HET-domain-containing protein [Seiridium unicorne]|uniref:HET-domain-containing protein n=1 Tax=Seiridium unicorne TaxID=138068 RepID=A0ABR2UVI5_9PEZI